MRLISLSTILLLACGGTGDDGAEDAEATTGDDAPVAVSDAPVSGDTPFGLMNGANPSEALYTAGQPTGEAIEAAYEGGVRTVISLRAESEPGQEEALAAIERLGMRFERLVINGAEGVTPDNAQRLDELLAEASQHGHTLVHCGSSNRVGAVVALRAFFEQNATIEDALEQGRAAGLVRLEGRVREVLDQTCAAATDDTRC